MGAGRNPQVTVDDASNDSLATSPNAEDAPGSPKGQSEPAGNAPCSPDTCVRRNGDHTHDAELAHRIHPMRPQVGNIKRWMADTGASVDALDLHFVSKAGRKKIRKLQRAQEFE